MIVLSTTEREYAYGVSRSTNASKVKVILEEKGLPYRIERLRPGDLWQKPPEMLAKHPLGKVLYLARLRARPSYQSISPTTSLVDSAGRE